MTDEPSRLLGRLEARWTFAIGVAIVLGSVAAYLSRTTNHLHWPYDVDMYRDIGQAEWVRQGHLLGDASYRGEAAWYNPLLSWVVAAISKVSGISVATVTVRGGVVLNLLAPVALTVLVARWFGRTAAGFALVAFVFLVSADHPSWAVATYSPWLFQANFAQGTAYLALLALPAAFERRRTRDAIVLGALMGVVALAHTAPALLLAAIVLVVAFRRVRRQDVSARDAARAVGIVAASAFVVASPLLVPLALRYRFDVRNELPTSFVWDELRNDHLLRFALEFGIRWPILLGIGATVWWWLRQRRHVDDLRLTVLITWTAVSFLALAVSCFGASTLPGASLVPKVVPSYHWFLYLSASVCVWFGMGVASVVRDLGARRPDLRLSTVATAVAVVMVAVALPQWRDRDERVRTREQSVAIGAMFDEFAVSRWIATSTAEDDVILYDLGDEQSLIVGALDARRTVVTGAFFSNPFVDWQARADDAAAMLAALRECRLADFATLAAEYGVGHVVTASATPMAATQSTCDGVREAYADPFATVLVVPG